MLDDADLPVLHVGGLDRAAATGLLGGVPAETADRLYLATAGNPLALTELARDTSRLATLSIDAPIPVPAQVTRAFARRAALLFLFFRGTGLQSLRQRAVIAGREETIEL